MPKSSLFFVELGPVGVVRDCVPDAWFVFGQKRIDSALRRQRDTQRLTLWKSKRLKDLLYGTHRLWWDDRSQAPHNLLNDRLGRQIRIPILVCDLLVNAFIFVTDRLEGETGSCEFIRGFLPSNHNPQRVEIST